MRERLFVVREDAIPPVLVKVLEAKQMLDSGECISVNDAIGQVGISRSTYYKYVDSIYTFDEYERKTVSYADLSKILSGIVKDGVEVIIKETDSI